MIGAGSWATFGREIVDEFFVLRRRRIMSWSRAAAYLLLMTVCTAWWYRVDIFTPVPAVDGGHSSDSLSLAVNRAFCGFPSRLSREAQISRVLMEDRNLVTLPMSAVIVNKWKTIDLYCATVTTPYLNNENSLMLLESWILRCVPNVSLVGIGRILLALQMTMVLLFCLALLRGGIGVLVCFGVVEIAAAILHQLQPLAYSMYAFFLPLAVLPIALYSLNAEASRRFPVHMLVALVGGIVTAFGANMRTSYLPVHFAVFLLYLLAVGWRLTESRREIGRRLAGGITAVAFFAAGYGAFHSILIRNDEPGAAAFKAAIAADVAQVPADRNRSPASTYPPLSYHVVWHPIVLALAIPTSPLSEREGIHWHDATGLVLARRVDSSVDYLGPGYEAALSTYYFDLWRKYPSEMRQIYISKFKISGRSMIETARYPSRWLAAALAPLVYLPNGLWLLTALVAGSGSLLWWYTRTGTAAILAFAQLTCIGALLVIESAITVPVFFMSLHSMLLFACSVTSLFLGQLVLNVPVWIGERLMARRTPTVGVAEA